MLTFLPNFRLFKNATVNIIQMNHEKTSPGEDYVKQVNVYGKINQELLQLRPYDRNTIKAEKLNHEKTRKQECIVRLL